MQINNMKNKYNLIVVALALGVVFLYNSNSLNEPHMVMPDKKPVFFNRMPNNFKKIRQHITIDIDYEKLPARNEIRLIGKVHAPTLESETIDYKWVLKNNLVLKSGAKSGKLNLSQSKEVSIVVAIKDMNKKVDVKLQTSLPNKKIKLGASQNFTYDPTKPEPVAEQTEPVTKKEKLEKALFAPRKISAQQ